MKVKLWYSCHSVCGELPDALQNVTHAQSPSLLTTRGHVVDFPNHRISESSRLSIARTKEQMQVPVLKIPPKKQRNQPNGVSQMPSKINARDVRPRVFRRAHATRCVERAEKSLNAVVVEPVPISMRSEQRTLDIGVCEWLR